MLSVDAVELADLTDDDARPDGFESAVDLLAEIKSLYAEQIAAGHQAYRVTFELIPGETKEKSA